MSLKESSNILPYDKEIGKLIEEITRKRSLNISNYNLNFIAKNFSGTQATPIAICEGYIFPNSGVSNVSEVLAKVVYIGFNNELNTYTADIVVKMISGFAEKEVAIGFIPGMENFSKDSNLYAYIDIIKNTRGPQQVLLFRWKGKGFLSRFLRR